MDDIVFGGEILRNLRINCPAVLYKHNSLECPKAQVSFESEKYGDLQVSAQFLWDLNNSAYHLNTGYFAFAEGRVRISMIQTISKGSSTPHTSTVERHDFSIIFSDIDANRAWQMGLPMLPPELSQYDVEGGTISGAINCENHNDCHIQLNSEQLNFSGINAAEDANLEFDLLFGGQKKRLTGALRLTAGALYIEPGFSFGTNKPGFLIAATTQPVEFTVDANLPSVDQALQIHEATISHPDVVDMNFAGSLSFADKISWDSLTLNISSPHVENMYATYIQPVIFGSTVDSLELSGEINVALRGKQDEITDLEIRLDDAYFDDAYDRFAMYKLNGNFVLTSSLQPQGSSVSWEGASIYGISLGAGEINWDSKQRDVWISAWEDVTVFDGALSINELTVNGFGTKDATVALSGSLSPVSMPLVMASFGLPPLAGKVSATLPQLSFKRNKLLLDGDIELKLFEGVIKVANFEIADLFSSVPRLKADIAAEGIDLATLTSTFSFGNISGTLDVYIRSLQLDAWLPRSFDAFFATREDDDVRHRISRQAVDNLGRIGAQTSVLSSGWLRFIPSYSYGRLGLGCRLQRGFCAMSGVEESGERGFFVLTSGGVLPPWINIKGQGRLISWQALLEGIEQISSGEVAVEVGTEPGRKKSAN